MEYRAGTPIYAFVLAVVSGTLFATSHYIAGGIVAIIAIVLLGLWLFATDRGDDDRHTIW